MTEEKKKEEGAQEKIEEKIEKSEKLEPTITEDELVKSIKFLEDIIKARKAPPEEEEEDEEEEDEEEEKSVTGNFEEDETIAKAIEVSEFLAALVDQTETSLDAMNSKVNSMEKSMSKFDQKYIESLAEVGKMIKSVSDSTKVYCEGRNGLRKIICSRCRWWISGFA
jgi:hypothetical protein